MKQYFWGPDDIAEILACSKSKAYKLIQKFNKELNARGFETLHGKVPKQYAIDRLGIEARA